MSQEKIDLGKLSLEDLQGKAIQYYLWDGNKLLLTDGRLELTSVSSEDGCKYLAEVNSGHQVSHGKYVSPPRTPLTQHLFDHIVEHPASKVFHLALVCKCASPPRLTLLQFSSHWVFDM